MTRRIVLTLADDTTATHCGSCRHERGNRFCLLLSRSLPGPRWSPPPRDPECLAAEAAASRLVEIAPEDEAHFAAWAEHATGSAVSETRWIVIVVLREHGWGR